MPPAAEAPAAEAPAAEAPATMSPAGEAPIEAPIEAPDAIEASAIEAPSTMSPTGEAPIDAPDTIEASAVEAPAIESPSTMPPATQAPATQAPTTMPLPPEARYDSLDALKKAINGFAKAHGYAFVIRRSRSMSSGRKKIIFDCDRHGEPPGPRSQRQRHTNSRLNRCLFSVSAAQCIDNRQHWQVKHRPGTAYAIHNHPPSIHPLAHPIHRRLE
jgi:hypothetical protein